MTLGTALSGSRFTYLQPSCTCVSWQLEKYPNILLQTLNQLFVNVDSQESTCHCCGCSSAALVVWRYFLLQKKKNIIKMEHTRVCVCLRASVLKHSCMHVCMYACIHKQKEVKVRSSQ